MINSLELFDQRIEVCWVERVDVIWVEFVEMVEHELLKLRIESETLISFHPCSLFLLTSMDFELMNVFRINFILDGLGMDSFMVFEYFG